MRVAVIGAGIIGVTTAWELACDGHRVSVFERSGSVAAQSSFANAGLVAPGYVAPWAAPGMPRKVMRGLFSPHAAVRLDTRMDITTARWVWQWLRACRSRNWQARRSAMQRLALFSKHRLDDITQRLRLDYERSDGVLILLRTPDNLASARAGLESLAELGISFKLLDAQQCAAIEPGLNADVPLRAGIHLPSAAVGNCRQFALLLRNEAQAEGVSFRFHADVKRIVPGVKPQIVHVHADPDGAVAPAPAHREDRRRADTPTTRPMAMEPETENFDAIVMCAALGSVPLLARHGLRLPLGAVHGYSVTAPLRHDDNHLHLGPKSAVMDEQYKVAVSRLGARIRVAGSAELGGSLQRQSAKAMQTLYKVLDDWFPGVANMKHAQLWKGARPMMPDGPPLLGRSGLDGIWLNLGHGSSGWALSCGSARVLADLIAGREPAVATDGLGIERLKH